MEFHKRLSPRSVYFRYFSPLPNSAKIEPESARLSTTKTHLHLSGSLRDELSVWLVTPR